MSKQIIKNRLPRIPYSEVLYWCLGFSLPMQLAKHFWPDFSYLFGMRIDYLSPALYLSDLAILAALTIWIKQHQYINPKLKTAPVLLFLVVLIINFFVASSHYLFFFRLLQYLKIVTLILLFSRINQTQFRFFINGLIVTTWLALVLSVTQIWHQGSMQGLWYFLGERSFTINSPGIATVSLSGHKLLRAYAFFSHPNSLSGFYLPLVFVFLHLKKPLMAITAILLVLLSFSKFTIVLLALSLLFWFWQKNSSCRLCRFGQIGFIIWLILSSFLLKGDPLSLSSRFVSYHQAWLFIVSHSLGLGLGHYLHANLHPFRQPVHNVLLLLTLELGWLIWPFIVYYGQQLFKIAQRNRLSLLLLAVLFSLASFDHYLITLNQNVLLLGVIIGLIIGPWSRRQIPN